MAMSAGVALLSQLVAFSEAVSCILWLGQCSQAWQRTPLQWSTLCRMQRKHLRVGLCPVIILSSTWAQEQALSAIPKQFTASLDPCPSPV